MGFFYQKRPLLRRVQASGKIKAVVSISLEYICSLLDLKGNAICSGNPCGNKAYVFDAMERKLDHGCCTPPFKNCDHSIGL